MGTKLDKSTFPAGHGPNDFKCFGPPATKDGDFETCMIADLGCFNQSGVDSNKFYHGCICQSSKDSVYYVYFQWGRTGAKNNQFQFVRCSSLADAKAEFAKQLHDKNDKRGEWVNHPSLGRVLQARAGKDCYLVRPLSTRSTGLPDARTIQVTEGAKPAAATTTATKKTTAVAYDSPTIKLMRDLNVATVKYTRGAMTDDSIPTAAAIIEARDILTAAQQRVLIVGDSLNHQVADNELNKLTAMIYGRIPKKKDRGAPAQDWILSQNNIVGWYQDLDAFESALNTVGAGAETNDVFGGMAIKMRHIDQRDPLGEFLNSWFPAASRNMHANVGRVGIKNIWEVERLGDQERLEKFQDSIGTKVRVEARPLHQPKGRPDLDKKLAMKYALSHTTLLFHGTRSVNVSGILREGLRLPKQLVGVVITGALLGGGLYWADDWKKSIGYTSHKSAYWANGGGAVQGRGAFMFFADVALGSPYTAPGKFGYTAAPAGHHSVFGKAGHTTISGGTLKNNEWVVYDSRQQRLRYLVELE